LDSSSQIHISTKFDHLDPPPESATPTIGTPAKPAGQLINEELARGVAPMDQDGVVASPAAGVGAPISPSALHSAMEVSQQSHPPVESRAKISIKKFANMLQCKTLPVVRVIGCIIENAAFVMHMRLDKRRGTVTYYLPLLND
jgi:hypothetical protein